MSKDKKDKPSPPTPYCPDQCNLLKLGYANPKNCSGCHCLDFTPRFGEADFMCQRDVWVRAYIFAERLDHRGHKILYCVNPDDESAFIAMEGPILRVRRR